MERMREVIRGSLARSLRLLTEEDRLSAALPVACGSVLAAHCEVAHLDEARTLHLRVDSPQWMAPLLGMRDMLQHDLQRVAGVSLAGLHFVQAGSGDKTARPAFAERQQTSPAAQRPERRFTSSRSLPTKKENNLHDR